MFRTHITGICIDIIQLLWIEWYFEDSHFYSSKINRSLIDFPCLKPRIVFWIVFNRKIYGISIKPEFQKINLEEKLECAFKGKQVLLLCLYG